MEIIPDHILIKIFKQLDKNSIETVADVCLRWQLIISTTTALMNRLDLIVNMKNPRKLKASEAQLSKLPYRSITVKPKYFQDQRVLDETAKFLKIHANHVERLEFFLASSSTITKVIDNLSADKITHLTLSQAYKEYISDHKAVNLPNLKHLETHQASGLLKLIKSHKIENLKLIHDYDDYDTADERIEDFLLTCPNLKTLLTEHHFPAFNVEAMPFKLVNLTVSNVEDTPKLFNARQHQTLKKLLEVNLSTLELFLLGNFYGIDGILEYLLPRAKKLKYLFLVCPNFSKIGDFLCSNKTVTDLAITLANISDPDVEKSRKIIKACTAVEKLGLNSITHDVSNLIHEASKSLLNLQELSLYSTSGKAFKNIQTFEKLEYLYVERITHQNGIQPLMNVLLAAPNVRKLKVEMWGGERLAYLSKDRLKKILSHCPKLEEIWIGGLFKLPKSFVDGLKDTKSAVRKLTIETYDVDMIVDNSKRLLDTKVQCTALQWVSKRRSEEDIEYSDTEWLDDDDTDGRRFFDDDEEMVLIDIEGSDEELDDTLEDDDENENVDVEVDDRFDAMGRRRSKRLRLGV